MKMTCGVLLLLTAAIVVSAQDLAGNACVTVGRPQVSKHDKGRHIVQDVTLASAVASYTLRYDIVELADEPGRVAFAKWAPMHGGYTPLGIAAPSMACWYNQGFFVWTLDDLNIQTYQAQFRVVRDVGPDAMVEYVWDTPKAVVTARFAIAAGSDKLLFFGQYEPKQAVTVCKLRLMAYPATFSKPHVRSATTAVRTLEGGPATLDPATERWVLLEDTAAGRTADGSAGLLLGDASVFESVTLDGIGGYGEYVNLTLKPDQRSFALALYEFPGLPDPLGTREYFRQTADAECAALASLQTADLDQPVAFLPVARDRAARIEKEDIAKLDRPAELWRPDSTGLDFPWAANLPDGPVRVALLCPRWAAYETMELGRRLDMNVRHQYFDSHDTLASANAWPYHSATGIGTLGTWLALKQALRVCSDPAGDVIMITTLNAASLPQTLRASILDRVRAGKGLFLTGSTSVLKGWPRELTAAPDDRIVARALEAIPWTTIPGLRETNEAPLRGYQYGQGRVVVLAANIGRYSALVPTAAASEGLDGAADRILAMNGLALLAAAGRMLPATVRWTEATGTVAAGKAGRLPFTVTGARPAEIVVRIQDDHDNVITVKRQPYGEPASAPLPPLPGQRAYYVDLLLLDAQERCIGYAASLLRVDPSATVGDIQLRPSRRVHPDAVPIVDLADGGTLRCTVEVRVSAQLAPDVDYTLNCEVRDCFGRRLGTGSADATPGQLTELALALVRPVTVCHQLNVTLAANGAQVATRSVPFTIARPYRYGDFTFLMWSYARAETVTRRVQRACYELGAEMMDLCHMRGHTDPQAAREYAVAARSGLRVLPYVTRVACSAQDNHTLKPGLFDADWFEQQRQSMQISCRQAAPYAPPAYTLGDENYMSRGKHETCAAPETMAAFQRWLETRYETITELNRVWSAAYADFAGIAEPMWLEQAAEQTESFAPWFDLRNFMDTAFAELHERLADVIRQEDPGAKVGWDGFLGYHWLAGYDFHKLSRNLELNQSYTSKLLQGELVRSFKRPDALTGEWGNRVADNEAGFTAIGWYNLFRGHNSCWWWTSWGCDYIPFNPDLSVSKMGEWYFRAADELRAGPGRLLLHATRDDSGIAILYSHADMFAAKLMSKLAPDAAFAGDAAWLNDLRGLIRTLEDAGYQYQFVAAADIESNPTRLSGFKALFLPLTSCVSDELSAATRTFAERGGLVIADGRVGMLTGNGVIRGERAFASLFGIEPTAGLSALKHPSQPSPVAFAGTAVDTHLLEPGLTLTTGTTAQTVANAPVFVQNTIGRGKAVLLNVPFSAINGPRNEKLEGPILTEIAASLMAHGIQPYCRLQTEDGPARCVEQTLFSDGNAKYLCLQQDALQPHLPAQAAVLTLPEPAFVYDTRAARQLGQGKTNTWHVEISRGNPRLFALLPYTVTGLTAAVSEQAEAGRESPVTVQVAASDGRPGFHVVHMAVFAPGSRTKHRQYSINIDCPAGKGSATVPFAVNDPPGAWRLECRDAASGTRTSTTVTLAGAR